MTKFLGFVGPYFAPFVHICMFSKNFRLWRRAGSWGGGLEGGKGALREGRGPLY